MVCINSTVNVKQKQIKSVNMILVFWTATLYF